MTRSCPDCGNAVPEGRLLCPACLAAVEGEEEPPDLDALVRSLELGEGYEFSGLPAHRDESPLGSQKVRDADLAARAILSTSRPRRDWVTVAQACALAGYRATAYLLLERSLAMSGADGPDEDAVRGWMTQIRNEIGASEPAELLSPPAPPEPQGEAVHLCVRCGAGTSLPLDAPATAECPLCGATLSLRGEVEYICPHCARTFWRQMPDSTMEVQCPHCGQKVALAPLR